MPKGKTLDDRTITDVVDKLGWALAEAATLNDRIEFMKKVLIEQGKHTYAGNLFDATVSKSIRKGLDLDAVRKVLSRQFIRAHTKKTKVTTVRVVARVKRKTVLIYKGEQHALS